MTNPCLEITGTEKSEVAGLTQYVFVTKIPE